MFCIESFRSGLEKSLNDDIAGHVRRSGEDRLHTDDVPCVKEAGQTIIELFLKDSLAYRDAWSLDAANHEQLGLYRTIVEIAGSKPDDLVLDIGIGIGGLLSALQLRGCHRLIGLDINPYFLLYNFNVSKIIGRPCTLLNKLALRCADDFSGFTLGGTMPTVVVPDDQIALLADDFLSQQALTRYVELLGQKLDAAYFVLPGSDEIVRLIADPIGLFSVLNERYLPGRQPMDHCMEILFRLDPLLREGGCVHLGLRVGYDYNECVLVERLDGRTIRAASPQEMVDKYAGALVKCKLPFVVRDHRVIPMAVESRVSLAAHKSVRERCACHLLLLQKTSSER